MRKDYDMHDDDNVKPSGPNGQERPDVDPDRPDKETPSGSNGDKDTDGK